MNCGIMNKIIYEYYLVLLWIPICMIWYLLKSLRIIGLVWPTRLIFLVMGEVLSFGFNLAVSFPNDSRGSKTRIVSLPSRIKRWGLYHIAWCWGIDSCNMNKTPSCYPRWQQYNTCLAAPAVTGKGHRNIESKAKYFSHCKKDQSSRHNQTDNSRRLAKITNHT